MQYQAQGLDAAAGAVQIPLHPAPAGDLRLARTCAIRHRLEFSQERATAPPARSQLSLLVAHLTGADFKHQLACGSVNIFIGPRPPKQWALRRARKDQQLTPPSTFEHFDFSGPLLQEGVHFIHVPVNGGGNGVCRQLQSTLTMLESQPERAQCVAAEGARLSKTLSMDRVYDYMAGLVREASLRQQEGLAKRVVAAERSRLVARQNYFSFIPPAKRPWMEHIFVPWYRQQFNETPMLPPHGAETASGLFH